MCRIDIDIHEVSPDLPSRSDWILDQRSVVLAESLSTASSKMASVSPLTVYRSLT